MSPKHPIKIHRSPRTLVVNLGTTAPSPYAGGTSPATDAGIYPTGSGENSAAPSAPTINPISQHRAGGFLVTDLSYSSLRVFRYKSTFARRIVGLRNKETRTMKNDTQIQQDVLAELERDEALPAGSIGVEVHHGVVKLASRIGDAETKKRAALDARRVDGVTGIILDMGIESR